MVFKFIGETLQTLSVTTYQPVGWSLQKVHERVRTAVLKNPNDAQEEVSCPVIFVHGIFHNSTAFYRLQKKCRRHGFNNLKSLELWTSLHSLYAMAQQLHQLTERLHLKHRNHKAKGRVRIVAHSLGGMITRTALLNAHFASLVDKVIFLGTPHQGSPLYSFPFPPCLRDLAEGSALLKRLKSEPLAGGIDYWNLRGGLDVITPSKSTFLPGVPNLVFDDVGHAGLLSHPKVIRSVLTLLEDIPEKSSASEVVMNSRGEVHG